MSTDLLAGPKIQGQSGWVGIKERHVKPEQTAEGDVVNVPAGAERKRDYLERRAVRATAVIAALRRLESDHPRQPRASRTHVQQAIDDFEAEVAAISARLRALAGEPTPARVRDVPPGNSEATRTEPGP
jgi:hypothetical protein